MTWNNPNSTTWDKTRDTITAGLAVTGAVLMFTPLAPVGVALTVAAGLWDIGTKIYDANHVAINKFVSGAVHSVGNAEVAAAKTVSHVATDVVNEGKSVLGGITHSLGLGWP
jgi:hypothetical protein